MNEYGKWGICKGFNNILPYKKYSENVQPLSKGFFFLLKIHKLIDNMSIPNQVMYPKVLKKQAEKNKHISTLIFTTALVTLANKWKESKCP